jgi:transcriptional regulator with XRE-family HTH domain
MVTQPTWAARLTRTVAGEVRRYRQERGFSAQQLADRCADLGMDISRTTIADLENGRRVAISLAELLVLAAALDVAPVLLAFPLGRQETVEALPGREVPTWEAAMWFCGDGDLRLTAAQWEVLWNDGGVVPLFLEHQRLAADLRDEQASRAGAPTQEDIKFWRGIMHQLRDMRSRLRKQGLAPPPLPAGLANVDERKRLP